MILCYIYSNPSIAQTPNGHIKLEQSYARSGQNSLASSLQHQDIRNTNIDFRLNNQHHIDEWVLIADYQLSGAHGSAVELTNHVTALLPSITSERQDSQWFDLEREIISSNNTLLKHRVDRLSVSYNSEQLVVKLGRQAVSWGNGLVFRPMDLFNPFAPDATDTSYKPGSDMLYGQYLLTDGSDISALIIPRRNTGNMQIDSSQSSSAIKWHHFGQHIQTDMMLAVDYEDTIFGISINGPVAEAVWRLDVIPVFLDQGGSRTSMTANLEHAWGWHRKNLSGYIEYYRNGFGNPESNTSLASLSTELSKRISRGQVFNSGRDYLSVGMRIEWTPLLQFNPLFIINLNDNSTLLYAHGIYNLQQNMNLVFGASISQGSKGSEYGGIETSPGSGTYIENPDQIYARIEYYY